MTNYLQEQDRRILVNDDLKVLWRINEKLKDSALTSLMKKCKDEIVRRYVQELMLKEKEQHGYGLTLKWFDKPLPFYGESQDELRGIHARVLTALGDYQHSEGNFALALHYYELAINQYPLMPSILAKYVFERSGRYGRRVRRILSGIKHYVGRTRQYQGS
jgi:hypothetical protein